MNNSLSLKLDSTIFVDFDLAADWQPELIFYNFENKIEQRFKLSKNTQLDWYVHPNRYCVGYHTYDEYHAYVPCPLQQEIEKGFQCDSCKMKDLLIPCMLCKGDECHAIQQVKNHCDVTPTSVYLVTFGDQVKVGVSKKDRLMKRWLEQGAELATEVALLPNGLLGRAVEETISQEFLITKGIRLKTKFNRVAQQNDGVMDEDRFVKITTQVVEWIAKKYGMDYVGNGEINNLTSHYEINNKAIFLDTKSNVALKGKFIGMKGPIFLLNSFGQNVYFDVRDLRGRKIGNSVASGSQGLLTDFF